MSRLGEFRIVLASVAAAALLVAQASGVLADDLDDLSRDLDALNRSLAETEKTLAEVEVTLRERFQREGLLLFRDQTHYVSQPKLYDKAWDVKSFLYRLRPPEEPGPQLSATWTGPKAKDGQPGATIQVVATRYAHKSAEGASLSTQFGAAAAPNADPLAMLKGMFAEWTAGLEPAPEVPAEGAPATDPAAKPDPAVVAAQADKRATAAPAKRKTGITSVAATAQGVVSATKARQRREWYAWADPKAGATWILAIRYDAACLEKPEFLKKGKTLVEALRTL